MSKEKLMWGKDDLKVIIPKETKKKIEELNKQRKDKSQ